MTTQASLLVQRILCSLEAQASISATLKAAISVASAFDATLDVLQIRETRGDLRQLKYISFEDQSSKLFRSLDAYQQFDQMVQAAGAAIRVATHQADGPSSSAVLRHAKRVNYDLVVIDGSPRGDVSAPRSSDVGRIIAAEEFRGVLTVGQSGPLLECKRILLPIDFAEANDAAVEWAAAFAKRYAGAVQILHVISPHALQVASANTTHSRAATAEHGASAVEAKLRQQGLRTSSGSRVHENAATAILEEYSSGSFDLVVMATHGFSRRPYTSKMGTVARLRQHREVSLLSVRGDEPNGEFVRGDPAELQTEPHYDMMDSTGTSERDHVE